MNENLMNAPRPFLSRPGKPSIPVVLVGERNFKAPAESGFTGRPGTFRIVTDEEGRAVKAFAGVGDPVDVYDLSPLADALAKSCPAAMLAKASFVLETKESIGPSGMEDLCLGWALACHRYDFYKTGQQAAAAPRLVWPGKIDRDRVLARLDALCVVRNLVNTPSNDMGPEELEQAARILAERHGASIRIVKGAPLEKGFPLIHAVGVSSPRAPRLIELRRGEKNHPKITLAGKGVCFDTGGLNLKPGQYMLQMKKDMGGAAHVLGAASAIMAMDLPVDLRVLIPAVENSVSGTSFRPRDVYRSRKGLTVETSDTDAEGRLVIADCLAYACEDRPDLLIDCTTLTGSARAALGYDIPALFSNRGELAAEMQACALACGDPVWQLPLWQGYKKELSSDIADLNNIGTSPAGAITGALFLEHFVDPSIDWMHLDMYAWEQNGRPGRPRGGADTGLRALLAFLEKRYGTQARAAKRARA